MDDKDQNSWKDLEALLGLPPEPAPGSRATEKPAPRPDVVMPSIEPAEASAEEPRDGGPGEIPERGRGRRRGGRRPDSRRGRDEPVEEAAPTASVTDEPAEPAGDVATEPSPEAAGNEEQGDRARGRRRRGRRSRRGPDRPGDEPQAPLESDDAPSGDNVVALPADQLADEPVENDLEASPEPVGAEEGPERRPRRGRPRRRSRSDDEPAPRSDAESPDVVAADVPPDDDDAGSEDNLSDWSVPSWQELVDSLHRPDR